MGICEFERQLKNITDIDKLAGCFSDYLTQKKLQIFSFTLYTFPNKLKYKITHQFSSPKLKRWHDYYLAENYDTSDHTYEMTTVSSIPVHWSLAQQLAEATTERERKMRKESIEYGVEAGVSIPVHGIGNDLAILMVGKTPTETDFRENTSLVDELFVAAHYYYHYLRKLLDLKSYQGHESPLNERQIECLALIARNYSVPAIAKDLKITERTVNYHIQRINKMLGAKNKYQSVAKAIELGLIK